MFSLISEDEGGRISEGVEIVGKEIVKMNGGLSVHSPPCFVNVTLSA